MERRPPAVRDAAATPLEAAAYDKSENQHALLREYASQRREVAAMATECMRGGLLHQARPNAGRSDPYFSWPLRP